MIPDAGGTCLDSCPGSGHLSPWGGLRACKVCTRDCVTRSFPRGTGLSQESGLRPGNWLRPRKRARGQDILLLSHAQAPCHRGQDVGPRARKKNKVVAAHLPSRTGTSGGMSSHHSGHPQVEPSGTVRVALLFLVTMRSSVTDSSPSSQAFGGWPPRFQGLLPRVLTPW